MMFAGVRPTIRLASAPIARTRLVLASIATTDGSLITIPRSRTWTSVLAVPRSIPMSREKRPRRRSSMVRAGPSCGSVRSGGSAVARESVRKAHRRIARSGSAGTVQYTRAAADGAGPSAAAQAGPPRPVPRRDATGGDAGVVGVVRSASYRSTMTATWSASNVCIARATASGRQSPRRVGSATDVRASRSRVDFDDGTTPAYPEAVATSIHEDSIEPGAERRLVAQVAEPLPRWTAAS